MNRSKDHFRKAPYPSKDRFNDFHGQSNRDSYYPKEKSDFVMRDRYKERALMAKQAGAGPRDAYLNKNSYREDNQGYPFKRERFPMNKPREEFYSPYKDEGYSGSSLRGRGRGMPSKLSRGGGNSHDRYHGPPQRNREFREHLSDSYSNNSFGERNFKAPFNSRAKGDFQHSPQGMFKPKMRDGPGMHRGQSSFNTFSSREPRLIPRMKDMIHGGSMSRGRISLHQGSIRGKGFAERRGNMQGRSLSTRPRYTSYEKDFMDRPIKSRDSRGGSKRFSPPSPQSSGRDKVSGSRHSKSSSSYYSAQHKDKKESISHKTKRHSDELSDDDELHAKKRTRVVKDDGDAESAHKEEWRSGRKESKKGGPSQPEENRDSQIKGKTKKSSQVEEEIAVCSSVRKVSRRSNSAGELSEESKGEKHKRSSERKHSKPSGEADERERERSVDLHCRESDDEVHKSTKRKIKDRSAEGHVERLHSHMGEDRRDLSRRLGKRLPANGRRSHWRGESSERLNIDLKCPHCPGHKSYTFEDYRYHLDSRNHRFKLDQLTHQHTMVLRRIRLQQRNELRDAEEQWENDHPDEFKGTESKFCSVCKLAFKCKMDDGGDESIAQHQESKLHKAQLRYLRPKCSVCKMSFPSRMVYELHIASIRHLKMMSLLPRGGGGVAGDRNKSPSGRAERPATKKRSQRRSRSRSSDPADSADPADPEDDLEKDVFDLDLDNFVTMDSLDETDNLDEEKEEITGKLEDIEKAEEDAKEGEEGEGSHCEEGEVGGRRQGTPEEGGNEGILLEESNFEEELEEPVGMDFVVPFEGMWCKLCCRVFHVDDDERDAVNRHCRTSIHAENYQMEMEQHSEEDCEGSHSEGEHSDFVDQYGGPNERDSEDDEHRVSNQLDQEPEEGVHVEDDMSDPEDVDLDHRESSSMDGNEGSIHDPPTGSIEGDQVDANSVSDDCEEKCVPSNQETKPDEN